MSSAWSLIRRKRIRMRKMRQVRIPGIRRTAHRTTPTAREAVRIPEQNRRARRAEAQVHLLPAAAPVPLLRQDLPAAVPAPHPRARAARDPDRRGGSSSGQASDSSGGNDVALQSEPTAADARSYIGSSASSMIAAIGSPTSSQYSPSCMGDGDDGELYYGDFTVYTYRENGQEQVVDVE